MSIKKCILCGNEISEERDSKYCSKECMVKNSNAMRRKRDLIKRQQE